MFVRSLMTHDVNVNDPLNIKLIFSIFEQAIRYNLVLDSLRLINLET